MPDFKSILRIEFADFLSMREVVLSESAYAHDCHYLTSFDSYLINCNLQHKEIYESVITEWVKNLSGKSSSVGNKVIVIRMFLRYLSSMGIRVFMPPIPKVTDDYIPYIFSDEELKRIFALSDNIILTKSQPNPYIQLEFPMMLRIMYGCGLRVGGETLALKMKDVDLDGGILILKQTKGDKQRLVPMHQTLTSILIKYCLAMALIGKAEALLFPSAIQEVPLSVKSARNKLNTILKYADISLKGRAKWERGPCLHCLRHVFAFKSFTEAEKSGRSINDSVPYLSIYLGHDSLKETESYLKFSSELYPKAMELFEDYTLQVFPEVSCDE
ncbi:mobile element protein [Gracilibacillus boraciitolerans JCM 21714]|uniref:Mobile element protein n=1 Tax=Gracilibacillus boraciitolerans JCM 21714 TaxID=1298598 RepID=W4VIA4_9BACI|nr:tyrosine-type recombinase/integrase [Gracilibacillus boraciitolerans]GAE93140.1 mobile element protein [Gracilibacillus boraciitolerans JCM 21714]